MRKHDSKKVRAVVGALDDANVGVKEILRRLQEDECGIGYRVDIKERAVYDHRTKYREAKARSQTASDQLDESIGAAKQQSVDIMRGQLEVLAGKNRLSTKEIAVLERIHAALARMEKIETVHGTSRSKPEPHDLPTELSAVERLAQAEAANNGNESAPPPNRLRPASNVCGGDPTKSAPETNPEGAIPA